MFRHDGAVMCGVRLACGNVKEEEEDCSNKV